MMTTLASHHEPRIQLSSPAASPRWALASLSLSMLLSSLSTSIANVGLPTLAQAFGASFPEVQWVVLAYLLSVTALIVTAGRLGDLVGRRRLMLWGVVTFTAASALCGFAPTLWLLIAARAVQGFGAAIMMALTLALVGEIVPKARTGSAMGLLGSMSAVGTALGPALGGWLISGFGWRALFFVTVPLGLLTFTLAQRHLQPDTPRAATARLTFDGKGALLLALALAAYALAATGGRGHFSVITIALLAIAVAGAVLFVLVESCAGSPLVPPALMRDRALRVGFALNAIVATVLMATLVVGPFYLSRVLGLGPGLTGLVLSAGPLVAMLTGMPAGRAVDRWAPPRIIIVALLAIATGCALLVVTPPSLGVMGYVVPIVVITAGYALFQAANNTGVMTGIQQDQRGVASGVLNLSRNLGLVTGASVMGTVFAVAAATTDIANAQAADVAFGLRVTFAVAFIMIVAALALAVAGRARAWHSPFRAEVS